MFLRCFDKVRKAILEDKARMKGFREDWPGCVSVICSYLVCVTALVGFCAFYGLYIVRGGYANQMRTLTESGLGSAVTGGTVILMYRSFVGYLMYTLIGLAAIFAIVEFYPLAPVSRKIIMSVNLSLFVLSTGFVIFMAVYMNSPGEWRDKVDFWVLRLRSLFRIEDFYISGLTLLQLSLILSLTTIVIFAFLAQKRTVLRILFAAVFSLGLLPFLMLVLENLLLIVYAIVMCVLLCVVFGIMLGSLLSGPSGSGKSGASYKSSSKPAEKKNSPEKKESRVIQIANNQRIYIDEGYGVGAPMTKCIFTDTPFMNRVYLCTLKEVQSGRVKIMRGGKEIHVS